MNTFLKNYDMSRGAAGVGKDIVAEVCGLVALRQCVLAKNGLVSVSRRRQKNQKIYPRLPLKIILQKMVSDVLNDPGTPGMNNFLGLAMNGDMPSGPLKSNTCK